jgi:hypothetical protein
MGVKGRINRSMSTAAPLDRDVRPRDSLGGLIHEYDGPVV